MIIIFHTFSPCFINYTKIKLKKLYPQPYRGGRGKKLPINVSSARDRKFRESRFITDTPSEIPRGNELLPLEARARTCIAFRRCERRGRGKAGSGESRGITDVTRFLDVDAEDNSHGTILCLLEESLCRLCRLNWKMLISIQPRARYSLSSERHPLPSPRPHPAPTPFLLLPSILDDEIKAREGKFYFALSPFLFLAFSPPIGKG